MPSLNFLLVDDNEMILKTVGKMPRGLRIKHKANAIFRIGGKSLEDFGVMS